MTLRIAWPTVAVLIAALLSVILPGKTQSSIPFDCLSDATDLVLYRWHYYDLGVPINADQWGELQDIPGDVIVLDRDNGGWQDLPLGIRGRWRIDGTQNAQDISVWLWTATGDEYYYLWAFNNTSPYAIDGEYWGVHPCGTGRTDKLPILNLIAKIQDNTNYWEATPE